MFKNKTSPPVYLPEVSRVSHICSAAGYCTAIACLHKEGHDLEDTCPKRCGRFPRAECFPVEYQSRETTI